jgi:hypothetical protein
MKDKLYDFLNKYHTLLSIWLFASLFGIIFAGENKRLAIAIMLLSFFPGFCALMFHMAEAGIRSHAKVRQEYAAWHQLYLDRLNSSSPHWDGKVRSDKDIEPRIELLEARMKEDREELMSLSARIDLRDR